MLHVSTKTAPGINLSLEQLNTLWVSFKNKLSNGSLESQKRSSERKQAYFISPGGLSFIYIYISISGPISISSISIS